MTKITLQPFQLISDTLTFKPFLTFTLTNNPFKNKLSGTIQFQSQLKLKTSTPAFESKLYGVITFENKLS